MATQLSKHRYTLILILSIIIQFQSSQSFAQSSNDANIAQFTEYINQNPKDDQGYSKRAYSYFIKKEYESAIKDLEQSLKINPKNYNSLFLVAQIYLLKQDFKNVYKFANEAILFNPEKDPSFYLIRGYGSEGAQDYKKAKADYETVLTLNPDQKEAKERLSIVTPKLIEQNTAKLTASNEANKQELADLKTVEKVLQHRQNEYDQIYSKISDLASNMSKVIKSEKISINDPKLKTDKNALKKLYVDLVKIWDERIVMIPKGLKGQAADAELQINAKRTNLISDWKKITGEDLL